MAVLKFSPDNRLVAAAGLDSMMQVWDLDTGGSLLATRYVHLVTMLAWAPVQPGKHRRYPTYTLASSTKHTVHVHKLTFLAKTMQYASETKKMDFPSRSVCSLLQSLRY